MTSQRFNKTIERKKEIIKAAMQLFSEKGYAQTSMRDIARTMGVSLGLCYRYFDSKQILFNTAIDLYIEECCNSYLAILHDSTITIKDKIDALFTSIGDEHSNMQYYDFFHRVENEELHEQLSIKLCKYMYPHLLEAVKKAMKKNTRVVYLETPANPNLKISDIEEIAKIAHTNEYTKVVVDNTFASPYLQRPLELGADLVVHSATKYLNGHGDVIAGFVVGNKELITEVKLFGIKDMTGSVLGPTEAHLIIRGLKTFEIRMQRHCENAMKVAEYLNAHPKVSKVYYPGLEDHEGYKIAKKQMTGFGGIMSFELKGGFEAGKTLLNNVEMCALAVSLGDTETLIQHPASMTHSAYTSEELKEAGIPEGLVRLSVGLENIEDIIADLDKALEKVK